MPRIPQNLSNLKFGHLTVLEDSYVEKRWRYWLCECVCGSKKYVMGSNLTNGSTQSCGCKRRDMMSTHGDAGSRLWYMWCSMKARCNNVNNPEYKNYGHRGIFVCHDWSCDYSKFKEFALRNGYSGELTIDRVDNNDGYHPGNVRFVSMVVQNRNKRSNRNILLWGETKCITDWLKDERITISKRTFFRRVKAGMPDIEALTTQAR